MPPQSAAIATTSSAVKRSTTRSTCSLHRGQSDNASVSLWPDPRPRMRQSDSTMDQPSVWSGSCLISPAAPSPSSSPILRGVPRSGSGTGRRWRLRLRAPGSRAEGHQRAGWRSAQGRCAAVHAGVPTSSQAAAQRSVHRAGARRQPVTRERTRNLCRSNSDLYRARHRSRFR
jgi:hypothetical protein